MKINFKEPRYVLPLILLPFLCLFFYVFQAKSLKDESTKEVKNGIQENVGEVSADVRRRSLTDKLDAFRNTYKESDGMTAVSPITAEETGSPTLPSRYNVKERARLDSIDRAMKAKFNVQSAAPKDRAFAEALNKWNNKNNAPAASGEKPGEKQADPMKLFKAQMAYMDSMSKASDPAYKEEVARKKEAERIAELKASEVNLPVRKSDVATEDFNTVMPREESSLISAMIDENVTGYAGSRIRLRLLEEIKAGRFLIPKGTYLFAEINGFNGQRVTLLVKSILVRDQILPVKLEVYDMDGLSGLFVPNSAFRDFTKDLSGNSMQGVNLTSGAATGGQLLMSSADKLFQSTSSAIASAIRKNKAKIKYNSYIYLIDPQALQNSQKAY